MSIKGASHSLRFLGNIVDLVATAAERLADSLRSRGLHEGRGRQVGVFLGRLLDLPLREERVDLLDHPDDLAGARVHHRVDVGVVDWDRVALEKLPQQPPVALARGQRDAVVVRVDLDGLHIVPVENFRDEEAVGEVAARVFDRVGEVEALEPPKHLPRDFVAHDERVRRERERKRESESESECRPACLPTCRRRTNHEPLSLTRSRKTDKEHGGTNEGNKTRWPFFFLNATFSHTHTHTRTHTAKAAKKMK